MHPWIRITMYVSFAHDACPLSKYKGKHKVKLPLCLTKHHAVKACGGVEV
jgi:hypothetical protein